MRANHIKELVAIVEKSNIDELEVTKWWGHKVRIRKNSGTGEKSRAEYVEVSAQPPVQTTAPAPAVVGTVASPAVEQPSADNAKYTEIKAPMVGTFYRSPSPDAEPFAKEGEIVSKGQTL